MALRAPKKPAPKRRAPRREESPSIDEHRRHEDSETKGWGFAPQAAQVCVTGAGGLEGGLRPRPAQVAHRSACDRPGYRLGDHRHRRHHSREVVAGRTWLLPAASLVHFAWTGSGLHRDRTDYAVSDSGSEPTFHGRNHTVVPRARGQGRYTVLRPQADGGRDDGRIWRKRRFGRPEHLRRSSDRFVAVE